MQITITGPRQGGSTTIAAILLRKLGLELGQHIKLVCPNEHARDRIKSLAASSNIDERMSHCAQISLVVAQAPEDAASIPLRQEAIKTIL